MGFNELIGKLFGNKNTRDTVTLPDVQNNHCGNHSYPGFSATRTFFSGFL